MNLQTQLQNPTRLNMKTKTVMLKAGLVGLFLMSMLVANAQLISASNPDMPFTSTNDATTIFVYGGNGFTLTASLASTDDGGEDGIDFSDYDWFIRNSGGGGDGIDNTNQPESATVVVSGTINNVLTVTDLAPGYYTFMAQGKTEDDICLSPQEEFTVFVLAPLTVTVTLGGDENTEYCADDLPENSLTASAIYDTEVDWNTQTNLSAPLLEDFELNYRWYKVAAEDELDIEDEDQLIASLTTNQYEFDTDNDAEVGEWNYYVVVDYTVKATGPYTNALGGMASPTIIRVTPKPGKPTITIEAL